MSTVAATHERPNCRKSLKPWNRNKPLEDWDQKDIDRFHRYLADEHEKARKTPCRPKCSGDGGCTPQPPKAAPGPPCEHLKVFRVPFSAAAEIIDTLPDNQIARESQYWACDACHKIMRIEWVNPQGFLGKKAPHYIGIDWASGPDATVIQTIDGKEILSTLEIKSVPQSKARHTQEALYKMLHKRSKPSKRRPA